MLGPLMVDIEGPTLTAADRELLRDPLIGGVILFARNYHDAVQLAALCREIHALRMPQLLIAVDQEGGRVQRFRRDFVELPALARIGEVYDADAEQGLDLAADCAWLMASELRAVGVDFSFAPVLDLHRPDSAIIADRALHGDPHVVARLAQVYAAGLRSAGMAAVGKHFPGHGSVLADSHVELPVDERDLQDIEQTDLVPFRLLVRAGIEGIMMAHVLYPRVDARVAGYSSRWIGEILRDGLGFDGVVFSDDLSMAGAADGSSFAARAERALGAGCDVLLICNAREAVLEVIEALGREARFPATQARLMRLHGRGRALAPQALREVPRWHAVNAALRRLNRFPELELGDDNLLP